MNGENELIARCRAECQLQIDNRNGIAGGKTACRYLAAFLVVLDGMQETFRDHYEYHDECSCCMEEFPCPDYRCGVASLAAIARSLGVQPSGGTG